VPYEYLCTNGFRWHKDRLEAARTAGQSKESVKAEEQAINALDDSARTVLMLNALSLEGWELSTAFAEYGHTTCILRRPVGSPGGPGSSVDPSS
jgi:hypothetical protein